MQVAYRLGAKLKKKICVNVRIHTTLSPLFAYFRILRDSSCPPLKFERNNWYWMTLIYNLS